MASGPSPSIHYTTFVELRPNGQDGGFLASGGSPEAGGYTVSELGSTGAGDNAGILGDTANERVTLTQPDGSTFPNNLNYYGHLGDKGVIVSFPSTEPSKPPGTVIYILLTNGTYKFGDAVSSASVSRSAFALCFGSGTHIRTARGEVPVEDLRIGDLAVTASGRHRTITWTGHRQLGIERPLPADQAPVRIRAGAFGHDLPTRDLFLSPGHPVLVGADAEGRGGVLVPIMNLVNGTTIARTGVTRVAYWHVELDTHDVLLAEGLAAESFLDFGCRAFFEEASDHALHNPDFVAPGLSARCRPVAFEGPVVEAERARLDAVFARTLVDDCAWDAAANRFATAA